MNAGPGFTFSSMTGEDCRAATDTKGSTQRQQHRGQDEKTALEGTGQGTQVTRAHVEDECMAVGSALHKHMWRHADVHMTDTGHSDT